jgi:hypothetical protein
MRPGDLVVINTNGDAELDGMLAIVIGDGPEFHKGVMYRKVLCSDLAFRFYLDDSLEKIS